MNTVNFQIGQCLMTVEVDRTKNFYRELPLISENCNCIDCEHFETVVTEMNFRLFEMLNQMGVNLRRQPNINPDGVCSTGETDKFQRAYMGYYKLFGKVGGAERAPSKVNSDGEPTAFEFRETEEDAFVQYTIKQESTDQLTIDFFIECERKYRSTT